MNNHPTGTRRRHVLIRAAIAFCAVLLPLLTLRPGVPSASAHSQLAANTNIYLPMVSGSVNPAPPPTQTPPGNNGGVFLEKKIKTNSAASAVDGRGMTHFAYAGYVPYGDPSPAYYATCASACERAENWRIAAVGDKVDEVQLAVTSDGRPRMLMSTSDHEFRYAACEASCENAAQWQVIELDVQDELDIQRWDKPQHYFAIDNQGRPRFVFFDDNGLNHAYYVFCDEQCTNEAAAETPWHATVISLDENYQDEEFSYPAIKFTPGGQPRILVQIATPFGAGDGLYYLACDGNCGDPSGWQRTRITDAQATWDLELDAAGRPRAAMYGTPTSNQGLAYAWCNNDCMNAASWQQASINVGTGSGEDPDMALDANGRPRIAYHAGGAAGLGYAWCDSACESSGGQWRTTIAEPTKTLDGAFEITVPFGCDQAGWAGGYRSSLALDPQGNPRIGYDALFLARCFYSSPSDPIPRYRIETLWRAARWVSLPKP